MAIKKIRMIPPNYTDVVHPETSADVVIQSATHRFVTDTEKSTWKAKQNAITVGATTIATSNLTASRALISDSSGKVTVSAVTSTELGYLDGVTSAIQTQIDEKANIAHVLSSHSDVATTAPTIGQVLKWNGSTWAPTTDDNTTYTAGNGLALSGTAFSVIGGNGLNTDASGLSLGTPSTLTTSTTNVATSTSHTHAVTFPVTSVNSKTGAVTLTSADIADSATKRFVTDTEKSTWNAKVSQSELTSHAGALTSEYGKHDLRYFNEKLEIKSGSSWIEVKAGKQAGGISKFAGNSTEKTIPHGLGEMPTSASAFPIKNPEGYLGEVWIRFDETYVYVGNTGTYDDDMSWSAIVK